MDDLFQLCFFFSFYLTLKIRNWIGAADANIWIRIVGPTFCFFLLRYGHFFLVHFFYVCIRLNLGTKIEDIFVNL